MPLLAAVAVRLALPPVALIIPPPLMLRLTAEIERLPAVAESVPPTLTDPVEALMLSKLRLDPV